jgi:hypothetical protein
MTFRFPRASTLSYQPQLFQKLQTLGLQNPFSDRSQGICVFLQGLARDYRHSISTDTLSVSSTPISLSLKPDHLVVQGNYIAPETAASLLAGGTVLHINQPQKPTVFVCVGRQGEILSAHSMDTTQKMPVPKQFQRNE